MRAAGGALAVLFGLAPDAMMTGFGLTPDDAARAMREGGAAGPWRFRG